MLQRGNLEKAALSVAPLAAPVAGLSLHSADVAVSESLLQLLSLGAAADALSDANSITMIIMLSLETKLHTNPNPNPFAKIVSLGREL